MNLQVCALVQEQVATLGSCAVQNITAVNVNKGIVNSVDVAAHTGGIAVGNLAAIDAQEVCGIGSAGIANQEVTAVGAVAVFYLAAVHIEGALINQNAGANHTAGTLYHSTIVHIVSAVITDT